MNSRAEKNNLYAEIFGAIPSAVVIIDRLGVVSHANPAAELLFGQIIVGQSWLGVIKEYFRIKADDGHEISLSNGKKVQVSTTPLNANGGQLVQITDLTETRALQDQMRQMEKLSNLGRMSATLAHQIRTPLSAAILYASNLGNKNLNHENQQMFQQKLLSRLHDLENQVSDILLFAKSGENIVDNIDLLDIVKQVGTDTERIFDEFGAELTINCEEVPFPMIANGSAIKGAISNLLVNALQANATHVMIRIQKNSENMILKIIDNGDGIEQENLKSIFEPFFTTKSSGTGLGLAVVKAVVNSHQGNVKVSSTSGQGTCFELDFPLNIFLGAKNESD